MEYTRIKNYAPVILSGIVQQRGDDVTTELPEAFVFHTPYVAKGGSPTTLTIACGAQVTVNLILGIPFIKATKMIINLDDNVAECKALDYSPFPIG